MSPPDHHEMREPRRQPDDDDGGKASDSASRRWSTGIITCSASRPSVTASVSSVSNRGAVDRGLASLPEPPVADPNPVTFEQALERGRPAIHCRGLDHFRREETTTRPFIRLSDMRGGTTTFEFETVQCRPGIHPRDPLAGTIRVHEKAKALRAAGRFGEAERACRHAIGGYEASPGRATRASPTRSSSSASSSRPAIGCGRRPAVTAARCA